MSANSFSRGLRLLAAAALALGLRAQGLTICTEETPPWHYRGPDGEAAGPAVEVVMEIQRRLGTHDPVRLMPWARAYAMLQGQPDVVLFLVARTAERNAQFQWVGPLVESSYGIYVKADSGIVLKHLDDAKKLHSIGVYRDDARDQLLTRAGFANLERANDNVASARKLLAGRIDAMVSTNLGIDGLMALAGSTRAAVREALPLSRVQFWIAFSHWTPAATVQDWARACEAMRKDGTLERIFRRASPAWHPPGPAITTF